jgi:hypothetical protein
MKSLFVAPLFAFAILTSAAAGAAERVWIEVPADIEPPKSQLTRAEVIADYHMWRLAGLQDLNRGEASPDTTSYQYQRAYATYVYLRSSPQFATLVNELQANPHVSVVASSSVARNVQASK